MINKILECLKNNYPLKAIEVGEFAQFKAKGMKFNIEAYHAEGLGHVSVMRANGFFGLMKMDTVIIVPLEKDLPLYSYDRILVMGNDTLIVELYDTMVNRSEFIRLNEIKEKFNYLTERDPGNHWYDSIKLPQSISKKVKKLNSHDLNVLAIEHFDAYINSISVELTDKDMKNLFSSQYVNGLLEQGGPSTDVFIKMFGFEKTRHLYNKILFGIYK